MRGAAAERFCGLKSDLFSREGDLRRSEVDAFGARVKGRSGGYVSVSSSSGSLESQSSSISSEEGSLRPLGAGESLKVLGWVVLTLSRKLSREDARQLPLLPSAWC